MGAVKAKTRAYRSLDELPEVVEPGRYVIGGVEVIVYEPVEREELVYHSARTRSSQKSMVARAGSREAALHALRT